MVKRFIQRIKRTFARWRAREDSPARVPHSHSFRIIPPKKISPQRIAAFWEAHDKFQRLRASKKRTKPWFDQTGGRKREPLVVSPSVLGTVRVYPSHIALKHEIRKMSQMNRLLSAKNFSHFVFQPVQIISIDREKNRLLERVYRAPTFHAVEVHDFEGIMKMQLYGKAFVLKMRRKNAREREVGEVALLAHNELVSWLQQHRVLIDYSPVNFLVLDYDPQTKKVLVAVVDVGGSYPT